MTRYWRRRLARHVAIALFGVTVSVGVMLLLGDEGVRVFRLSMGTAYASLALLACSLLIGPFNLLGRKPNPVSSDVRRDIGIWAGTFALAHVAFGLQVHLPGRMLEYFVWPASEERPIPIRHDAAGMTNWAGLVAALVLLMLMAISNDAALRRLGTARWKRIQRWSYAAFALMAFHGFLYQVLENRPATWIAAFVLVIAGVTAVQVIGVRARASPAKDVSAPL